MCVRVRQRNGPAGWCQLLPQQARLTCGDPGSRASLLACASRLEGSGVHGLIEVAIRTRAKASDEVGGGPSGRDIQTVFALLDGADPPPVRRLSLDAPSRGVALFSKDHGVHARPSK